MIDRAIIDGRSTKLTPGPNAPGQARRWISFFEGYLTPETAQDLEIVVSELVTNAVMHAGLSEDDSIELAAQVRGDNLRVTICDHGKGIHPDRLARAHDATMMGGWGLEIVRQLTRRVLIDADDGRVTFEVPLLLVR